MPLYIPSRNGKTIERKLVGLPTFNASKQKLLKRTSYYGQEVDFDGQGRLLLPAILRDSAGLKGEVSVAGRLTLPRSAECRSAPRRGARALHR